MHGESWRILSLAVLTAAIAPLRSDNAAVALNAFFGWPLTAVAS